MMQDAPVKVTRKIAGYSTGIGIDVLARLESSQSAQLRQLTK